MIMLYNTWHTLLIYYVLTHPIDLLPSLIPPLDLLQPLAHAYSEEAAAVIAKELYD